MSGRLAGRVCLVTGAGRGIGEAVATRFAEEGGTVALADRDDASVSEVAGRLRDRGLAAHAYALDVADLDGHEPVLRAVTDELGVVDVLVNNAGVGPHAAFLDVTPELWDHIHAVNLRGTFFLTRLVARHLVDAGRPGSVVNVTSVVAHTVWMPSVAYAASKAALVAVTEYAAAELGPQGIRVNALCPGPTDTPLSAPRYSDPAFRAGMLERIPLRRLGRPDDLAEAAVFLASDESSFTTGSTLFVDGGRRVG